MVKNFASFLFGALNFLGSKLFSLRFSLNAIEKGHCHCVFTYGSYRTRSWYRAMTEGKMNNFSIASRSDAFKDILIQKKSGANFKIFETKKLYWSINVDLSAWSAQPESNWFRQHQNPQMIPQRHQRNEKKQHHIFFISNSVHRRCNFSSFNDLL